MLLTVTGTEPLVPAEDIGSYALRARYAYSVCM